MLPRRRDLAVQRRSQRWRKNLARANRPSPVRRRAALFILSRTLALIQSILLCISRLTVQAPYPKNREAHSGSGAASKPVFLQGTLGDLVGL